MRTVLASYRALLHSALAALVVVASLHCACEWQEGFERIALAATCRAAHEPLPFMPPTGCDNESGCLCRGATQAQPLDVTHLQASQSDLLSWNWLPSTFAAIEPDRARSLRTDEGFSAPPISGRQLRGALCIAADLNAAAERRRLGDWHVETALPRLSSSSHSLFAGTGNDTALDPWLPGVGGGDRIGSWRRCSVSPLAGFAVRSPR